MSIFHKLKEHFTDVTYIWRFVLRKVKNAMLNYVYIP